MFEISTSYYSLIVPTLILIVGVVDDLRSKKIHNKLVLVLLALAAIYQFVSFGSAGLTNGLLGSGLAFLIFVPMVLSRMLGGGDMKLMLAFGMSTYWSNVLWTSIYSVIWAAVFGIIYAITHKQLTAVVLNTVELAKMNKSAREHTLKIPYSIALFMGWLQQILLTYVLGGSQ